MLKIKLDQIAYSIYGVKLERYLDWENYYFDSFPIEVTQEDKKRFIKLAKEIDSNVNVHESEIESLTQHAMFIKYESSYMDDMYKQMKGKLIEVILEDFKELNENILYDDIQFDLYNDDITIDEQLKVIEKDFNIEYDEKTEEFIFSGSMEKLAYGVLSAIHGYGMFRFSSLQEFTEQTEGETLDIELLKKSIKEHLFWLSRYNEIYGTGTFSFNAESYADDLDRYGSLGDFDFGKEEVSYVLDDFVVYTGT